MKTAIEIYESDVRDAKACYDRLHEMRKLINTECLYAKYRLIEARERLEREEWKNRKITMKE